MAGVNYLAFNIHFKCDWFILNRHIPNYKRCPHHCNKVIVDFYFLPCFLVEKFLYVKVICLKFPMFSLLPLQCLQSPQLCKWPAWWARTPTTKRRTHQTLWRPLTSTRQPLSWQTGFSSSHRCWSLILSLWGTQRRSGPQWDVFRWEVGMLWMCLSDIFHGMFE